MRITKRQLRHLIREEVGSLMGDEALMSPDGGTGGYPLITNKREAVAAMQSGQSFAFPISPRAARAINSLRSEPQALNEFIQIPIALTAAQALWLIGGVLGAIAIIILTGLALGYGISTECTVTDEESSGDGGRSQSSEKTCTAIFTPGPKTTTVLDSAPV